MWYNVSVDNLIKNFAGKINAYWRACVGFYPARFPHTYTRKRFFIYLVGVEQPD